MARVGLELSIMCHFNRTTLSFPHRHDQAHKDIDVRIGAGRFSLKHTVYKRRFCDLLGSARVSGEG